MSAPDDQGRKESRVSQDTLGIGIGTGIALGIAIGVALGEARKNRDDRDGE